MTRLLPIIVINFLICSTICAVMAEQLERTQQQQQQQQHLRQRQQHHTQQHPQYRQHHHQHEHHQHLPQEKQQQQQQHQYVHQVHNQQHRTERISESLIKTQQQPQQQQQQHPDEQVEFIDSSSKRQHQQLLQQQPHLSIQPTKRNSTRLRRVSARDYYNKVMQRRNNRNNPPANVFGYEWTYNVQTNTFGAPTTPAATNTGTGKGDDNMDDVEFISSNSHTNTAPEWALPEPNPKLNPRTNVNHRRSYGSMPTLAPMTTTTTTTTTTAAPSIVGISKRRAVVTTSAPPPMVPARRGYTTTTTTTTTTNGNDIPRTTDDPFETNTISRSYPQDPKEMERRHICVQQRTVTMPVKTTEVYTRPIWKHISTPCQPQTHANQMCTRVQLVHEPAFRDVVRHKLAQQVTYDCCTGWMRETPRADSCLKPVCGTRCQNGGTCSAPDTCTCPPGFTGRFCEHDINECKEEKPCDQTCVNTVGSFYCKCREGFVLQSDQQSCKKMDSHDDDAFEARDLENEIEAGDEGVSARLHKIERTLANERVQAHELQKSLQATYNVVDTLKSRLSTLEKQQHDFNRLQTNLYATETRTNRLEGMVNLLMKCRNGPNAYCP